MRPPALNPYKTVTFSECRQKFDSFMRSHTHEMDLIVENNFSLDQESVVNWLLFSLTDTQQISNIASKKVFKCFGFLRRCMKYFTPTKLLTIYITYIRPA